MKENQQPEYSTLHLPNGMNLHTFRWVQQAWIWLCNQYPNVEREDRFRYNLCIIFHSRLSMEGFDTPKFQVVRKGSKLEYCKVHLIEDINYWKTYKRDEVGIYAPTTEVGQEFSIKVQAVHELTHFIQEVNGRDRSESEATFNELKFVYENYFSYFKKCKVIENNKSKRDIMCKI